MNLLIVSEKSEVKTYENVAKTAPNISMLGAVTLITSDFIKILKEKWNPHIVVIDTSVPTKKVKIKDIIADIKYNYPYMKVIVLTDSDDNDNYPAYAVIKGQISNIQFKELIDKANKDSVNINTQNQIRLNSEPDDLSDNNPIKSTDNKVDKLFISENLKIKIPKIKFHNKKNKSSLSRIVLFSSIASAVLITIIITLCLLKFSNNQTVATNDEIPSVTSPATYDESSEQETTVSELIVSFTDPLDTSSNSSIINENNSKNSKKSDSSSSKEEEEKSESSSKSESSKSSSSSSKNSSFNSKTDKSSSSKSNSDSSSNKSSSSKTSSSSNSFIISYDNNQYSNSDNYQVSSITLSYSKKTLQTGDTITLKATVYPSNAKYNGIKWSSSNSVVASVNNGTVTAKKAGTATITASAGSKKSACTIIVNPKPTQKATIPQTTQDPVYLSTETQTIVINQTLNISLYNSTGCSWSISNPSVVQICGGGSNKISVKGIKTGTTTITATNNSTGKKYQCTVTVH